MPMNRHIYVDGKPVRVADDPPWVPNRDEAPPRSHVKPNAEGSGAVQGQPQAGGVATVAQPPPLTALRTGATTALAAAAAPDFDDLEPGDIVGWRFTGAKGNGIQLGVVRNLGDDGRLWVVRTDQTRSPVPVDPSSTWVVARRRVLADAAALVAADVDAALAAWQNPR